MRQEGRGEGGTRTRTALPLGSTPVLLAMLQVWAVRTNGAQQEYEYIESESISDLRTYLCL